MKKNFGLTITGQRRAKRKMFIKLFFLFFSAEAVLFIAVVYFWNMTLISVVGLAVVAVIILVISSVRIWSNPNINFSNWGLYLDDQMAYLTENREETKILRGDVDRVVTSSSGLILKGRGFGKQIWIPSGVEDYDEVKRKLQSWG